MTSTHTRAVVTRAIGRAVTRAIFTTSEDLVDVVEEADRAAETRESPLQHSEGVGLWLVTWIVEGADGSVTIETPDEEGVGTVVTLSLPVPN